MQTAAAAMVLCTSFAAQAQVALSEGFESVGALAGAGWQFVNTSPSPGSNWFQGNSGIFFAASGTPESYAAASFLGTTASSGPVTNWLITPQLMLDATSSVGFNVRVAGSDFIDRVDVLVSTTGTAPGDFSLLGNYTASVDAGWLAQNYAVGLTATTPAYIAFRYVVANVALNGNYLGIDDVLVTAVPEPATYGLMALGIAGLLLRRRFTV
jgi:hypothetical protein